MEAQDKDEHIHLIFKAKNIIKCKEYFGKFNMNRCECVCVCLPNGGFGGVSCFVFDFIAGQMTLKMFYLEQQSYKQILCNTCRGNKSKVCFKIIVHRINPCTLRHNDQKYTNFIQETILVAQVNFHMKVKNTQLPYYVFVSV